MAATRVISLENTFHHQHPRTSMLDQQTHTDWVTFGLIAGFLLLMVILAFFVVYFATGICNFVGYLKRRVGWQRAKSSRCSEDTETTEESLTKTSLDA
jgi:uncharacterized membrane protein